LQKFRTLKENLPCFCPNDVKYPNPIVEKTETIENIEIPTLSVEFDETKWKKSRTNMIVRLFL